MSYVAIDPSLRSTAIVDIDSNGNLLDFRLISYKKEIADKEHLILKQCKEIVSFIDTIVDLEVIGIEGLSFNAPSSHRDLISGLYWGILCSLRETFPATKIETIPVTQWRATVLSKEEQKIIRASKEKDGLKKAVVDKLPSNVREEFLFYMKDVGAKKEAIYDLGDAFSIAQYLRRYTC